MTYSHSYKGQNYSDNNMLLREQYTTLRKYTNCEKSYKIWRNIILFFISFFLHFSKTFNFR